MRNKRIIGEIGVVGVVGEIGAMGVIKMIYPGSEIYPLRLIIKIM